MLVRKGVSVKDSKGRYVCGRFRLEKCKLEITRRWFAIAAQWSPLPLSLLGFIVTARSDIFHCSHPVLFIFRAWMAAVSIVKCSLMFKEISLFGYVLNSLNAEIKPNKWACDKTPKCNFDILVKLGTCRQGNWCSVTKMIEHMEHITETNTFWNDLLSPCHPLVTLSFCGLRPLLLRMRLEQSCGEKVLKLTLV